MSLRNLNQICGGVGGNSHVLGLNTTGVEGQDLAATGTNGPGILFGSATLPADNNVEFRGLFTTAPAVISGTTVIDSFIAFPDGSYIMTLSGGNGSIQGLWTLYRDGVEIATGEEFNITIGSGSFNAAWAMKRSKIYGSGLQ